MKRLSQPQIRLLHTLSMDAPYVPRKTELEPLETLLKLEFARVFDGAWFLSSQGADHVHIMDARHAESSTALMRTPIMTITVWAADPKAQEAMVRHLDKHLKQTMHLDTPYEIRGQKE